VAYCSREPEESTNIIDEKITIRDTFPYNPDSKTAPATAERWANPYWNKSDRAPDLLVRANEPFSITITDLHVRSEGGRAYKVIDEEMRRFDLREDQVIEVMKLVGIKPRGSVPGKFVWGILGSQVRLVLVGGELHTTMVKGAAELEAFKAAQASGELPTESTLRFGTIYRKRDKTLHLFLGRVRWPGAPKDQYAFVQLPEPAHDWSHLDLEGVDKWKFHYREETDVSKRWNTMSWTERCHWEWYDKHAHLFREYPEVAPGYYHHPANIVLMGSPKFEAADGQDLDLARTLQNNEGSKHRYVNGHGDDLAEDAWEAAVGHARELNPRRQHSNRFYDLSVEKQQKVERDFHIKITQEVLANRKTYQDRMVWK
jgi:hypothetical protein